MHSLETSPAHPCPPLVDTPRAPVPESTVRIPSLDGIRAVSICLVLFSHLCGTAGFFAASALSALGDLGNLGVRMFFVISGFLISLILFNEWAATSRISLSKFYFRRAFRIFPAYYAFLGGAAILTLFSVIRLQPGDLFSAVTYTSNYHSRHAWYLGHTWSLSVEEQFYIIWPAVVLWVGKYRALSVAAAMILAAPLARILLWQFSPDSRALIGWSFPTIADALATGCLLAGLQHRLLRNRAYQWLMFWPGSVLILIAVFAVNHFSGSPRFFYPVGQSIINLSLAVLVHRCVLNPSDALGRVLNWRPVMLVGTLSYSLYLWQQLFLNRTGDWQIQRFPWNLLSAGLAAVSSYYLVEKPFLQLRARLEAQSLPKRISAGCAEVRNVRFFTRSATLNK